MRFCCVLEQPRDWQPKFFSDVDPEEVTKTLPEFMEDAPIHVGKIHTVSCLSLMSDDSVYSIQLRQLHH